MTRALFVLVLCTVAAFLLPSPYSLLAIAVGAGVITHIVTTYRRVLAQRGYLVVCRLIHNPRDPDQFAWSGVWLSRDGREHVQHIAPTYAELVDSFTTVCRHTDDDLKFVTLV